MATATKKNDNAHKVAAAFVARATAQGMKGRARDRAALEFVTGALAFALAIQGTDGADVGGLSILAFLTATRGYSTIEEFAESAPPVPLTAVTVGMRALWISKHGHTGPKGDVVTVESASDSARVAHVVIAQEGRAVVGCEVSFDELYEAPLAL